VITVWSFSYFETCPIVIPKSLDRFGTNYIIFRNVGNFHPKIKFLKEIEKYLMKENEEYF
jgi:hypothetical protein